MNFSGIYCIENLIDGKKYIGSSNNIKRRWYDHKKQLINGYHFNTHLQRAWNKYGNEKFRIIVLDKCEVCKLEEREQFWIDMLNVVDNGYNIAPFVDRHEKSKEAIEKYKKTRRKQSPLSMELGAKIYNMYKETNMTRKEIADRFNLSERVITKIINGKHWTVKGFDAIEDKNLGDITKKVALSIYREYKNKDVLQKELAAKYDIHIASVSDIVRGNHWTTRGMESLSRRLSKQDCCNIYDEYKETDKNMGEIAKKYGVTRTTISQIVRGKHWSTRGCESLVSHVELTKELGEKVCDEYYNTRKTMEEIASQHNIGHGTVSSMIKGEHRTTEHLDLSGVDRRKYEVISRNKCQQIYGDYKSNNFSQKELSEKYNIGYSTINKIVNGRYFNARELDSIKSKKGFCGTDNPSSKLIKQDGVDILKLYNNSNLSMKEVGNRYDVSATIVFQIVHREHWTTQDIII